ncbi:formate/nitrite transporter family protein, partial [Streptodolium elevatio]
IVNMFLFPSGLMLGGDFSVMDYLIWNEIPTLLGNLIGGLAFVGLTMYATHARTGPTRPVAKPPAPARSENGAAPKPAPAEDAAVPGAPDRMAEA